MTRKALLALGIFMALPAVIFTYVKLKYND